MLDDYIKIEHSKCASTRRFKSVNDAKMVCSFDARCIGVLSEDCGSSSTYYLCQGDIKKDIELVSCVHKKKEASGLFNYLCCDRSYKFIHLQYP